MKKKRKLLLIILISLAVIFLFYFVPRLLLVSSRKSIHGDFEEIEEIELPAKQNLRCDEFEHSGIHISIPIHDKDYEEFIIEKEDSPIHIRGYKYDITLWLNNGEEYFENTPIDNRLIKHYMNCTTRNEYKIKCLDITKKDLSIFKPIKNLRESYNHYFTKSILVNNLYSAFQKYGYFYVVSMEFKRDNINAYGMIAVKIYDIDNNYDFIGELQIFNNSMNLDEISFIAKSIRIDREE